ncbi:MAG: hypothetical protein U1F43_16780 [Myxococcota bacterium]
MLHGLATSAGVANITPLTDLALARVVADVAHTTLAAWAAAPTDLDAIAAALADGSDALRAALAAGGYTLPSSWVAGGTAPFTTAFVATPGSDPFDALLESVAAALAADGTTYADLLASFAGGGALPAAPVDDPGDPVDPDPTGDGAALGDADGATGTLDGTTYTYGANVSWGVLPGPDFGLFAAFQPTGGGWDPQSEWLLSAVPPTVGIHHCKSNGLLPRIQLVVGGVNHDTAIDGGSCTIEILAVTPGAITGRFSATLVNADLTVSKVTDGYFRKAVSTGGGQPLAPGEVGASFEVDGQTFRYTGATSMAFENEFAGMNAFPENDPANPGNPVGIQINTVPNRLGTFACDSYDSNEYRKLNIWFFWNLAWYTAGARQSNGVGAAGSSCSVTVTKVGSFADGLYVGTFEGTFEGTFVSADGLTSKVVTNGAFRYIGASAELPKYLSDIAGTYDASVTAPNDGLGWKAGTTVPIVIDPAGNITAGERSFEFGVYSVTPALQTYLAEPGINIDLPPEAGETIGTRLTIFMPDGVTPKAFRLSSPIDGVRAEASAAIRPIDAAMVDAIADLIAGSPYTLRSITNVAGGRPTHTMTVNGIADANSPYFSYNGLGAYEQYGDTYARLAEVGGDRVLTLYYSTIVFKQNGALELRELGGNHQEYATWTTDAAAISAAGCP